ncbi:arginine--tRNA ligase [Botrimarina hoheduenensis]|uniref:Arginine--tRNA ligase n=1 Tax=Botrimarina hoheduenensis TaxID=2528000 RepID=A0A5C5WCM5_9BACT|nr:arginine--tRNA ligase [Botrimarina hoheduenensis]TWT47789.1 Arginine--tRNA ligase [Botrimarina hoheduenensis]
MNALVELRRRFVVALEGLADEPAALAEMILPSQDPRFGDYQANCAMPLGKKLGKPPREIATTLVERLVAAPGWESLCDPPEIAGPGFINLRLKDDGIAARLVTALADTERLGIVPVSAPRKYVLDYSSPNVAKPMHVGHIRSTVIGDALSRVLRFLGHQVITDNHIGDWGTQFGMIIYGYKHFVDTEALAAASVAELSRLYKLVNQIGEHQANLAEKRPALAEKIATQETRLAELATAPPTGDPKQDKQADKKRRQAEGTLADLRREQAELEAKIAAFLADARLSSLAAAHPAIGAAALAETAKLHTSDPENVGLWKRFLPACLEEIQQTYDRLRVTFDHTLGESFYHDRLAGVVEALQKKGLARESDGAQCVFLEGYEAPFIVQKKDGAYLYATTDLATIQYRMEEWAPDAVLYVVDHRQSLHFEQLFATARQIGYDDLELQHISFGTVLGEDGKPYKTRSGSAVGLMGLLDEAVERAGTLAAKSSVLETDTERAAVAERIGIGAIKYADLSHNRTSDYVFSYDKMLAMQGNTAAYMQYSVARVKSIFGRGGIDPETLRGDDATIALSNPAERALAMELLRFTEALARVAAEYKPNYLTAYLFDLAQRFAEFFEQCPVLKADDDATKASRLRLCDLTARTLEQGLALLGIRTVERM